jgi:hypothetical protein
VKLWHPVLVVQQTLAVSGAPTLFAFGEQVKPDSLHDFANNHIEVVAFRGALDQEAYPLSDLGWGRGHTISSA